MRETNFKKTEIGNIPEDWNVKSIGDFAEVKGGKRLPEGCSLVNSPTPYPYIRLVDILQNKVNKTNILYLDKNTQSKISKYIVNAHDVCLAIVGHTIGLVFYIDTEWENTNLTENSARITGWKNVIPKYVFYYLLSSKGQEQIISRRVGSAQGKLPLVNIKTISIPIPSLKEQTHIASILGTLDDKIAINHSMNSTLEAIGQALFKRWFVDFEFPNGEGKPYKSSDGEMVETELGEVPRGWRIMIVGEVLELAYGKPLKDENRRKGNVPVYGSNGQIGWHDEKLVEGPGIVVGRKGNPGIVTWSHTAFFPIDTTFYIVLKAIRSMYYLFYILRLQDLQSLGADSAVPGLNRNVVYMNKMIVPSSETLEIFDAFLRKIYDKVQDNNEQSDILAEIRDALLPKLMSGEIRVNIERLRQN